MSVEYNFEQQTYLLSMIANDVAGEKGTADELEKELRERIEQELKKCETSMGYHARI